LDALLIKIEKGAVWQLSLATPVITTTATPVTGRLRLRLRHEKFMLLFHAKYNAGHAVPCKI
jgi:hypothetical protein